MSRRSKCEIPPTATTAARVEAIRTRPTLEEIRSWGKSFDKLMRSPSGRKAFREFLRCEYSEENILFWLACEELKKETNPEAIEEKARFIYEDYISILSPKEIYKLITIQNPGTNPGRGVGVRLDGGKS
ncbi:hypothetical protein quinque_003330 [Culex quinquefasciatus]